MAEKTEKEDSREETRLAHTWVKTEGFEKAVVLMMELNKMIWNVMNRNEDFRMVLEYHKEALNVSFDFFSCKDESECNSQGHEASPRVGHPEKRRISSLKGKPPAP